MKATRATTSIPQSPLLTFEQVGQRLGVVTSYARRLADSGVLPKVKIGRRCVRVPSSAVEEFIAKRTISAKGGMTK